MEKKNYYQILQVDQDAEPEIIEAAYKRLAIKYHPDINKTSNATSIMQEINTAYAILSNSDKRAEYDQARSKKRYNLVYKSDFFTFSHQWIKIAGQSSTVFRRDDYLHLKSNTFLYCHPGISLRNFKLCVDMEISGDDDDGVGGCFLGLDQNATKFNGYMISFTEMGEYGINVLEDKRFRTISELTRSPVLKRRQYFDKLETVNWKDLEYPDMYDEWNPMNSIVVEAREGNISLSANGEKIIALKENKYESGIVGLFVRVFFHDIEDTFHGYIAGRFRNFCLYSIE